jgi:3-deoxy-D-manno-octulosonic-acid transferase
MILSAYRAASTVLQPLGSVLLRRRMRHGKEDPTRLKERLGHASLPRPDGPLIWLHAASVGEAQSVLRLIERLAEREPATAILITSGTVTSAAMLSGRLPVGVLHQFSPIDLPAATCRFIDHWRPDLAIWIESELWPNLIRDMAGTGKPLVLINGRMSSRSFGRWRHVPAAARRMLAQFSLVLAQNEEAAERFRQLGAPEVKTEGNLKYAADPLPADPDRIAAIQTELGNRPFWLSASIHPGEDEATAAAHQLISANHPELLTIFAPRHPARAAEMISHFTALGLQVARRSDQQPIQQETSIYVADTMGELGLFYSLDGPVFVGGSLVPHGGQNVLEPARFGRCILTGPHTTNFSDVIQDMRDGDALIEVEGVEELAASLTRLLTHTGEATVLGERAQAVAQRQNAVLERVLARLAPLLPAS